MQASRLILANQPPVGYVLANHGLGLCGSGPFDPEGFFWTMRAACSILAHLRAPAGYAEDALSGPASVASSGVRLPRGLARSTCRGCADRCCSVLDISPGLCDTACSILARLRARRAMVSRGLPVLQGSRSPLRLLDP